MYHHTTWISWKNLHFSELPWRLWFSLFHKTHLCSRFPWNNGALEVRHINLYQARLKYLRSLVDVYPFHYRFSRIILLPKTVGNIWHNQLYRYLRSRLPQTESQKTRHVLYTRTLCYQLLPDLMISLFPHCKLSEI